MRKTAVCAAYICPSAIKGGRVKFPRGSHQGIRHGARIDHSRKPRFAGQATRLPQQGVARFAIQPQQPIGWCRPRLDRAKKKHGAFITCLRQCGQRGQGRCIIISQPRRQRRIHAIFCQRRQRQQAQGVGGAQHQP